MIVLKGSFAGLLLLFSIVLTAQTADLSLTVSTSTPAYNIGTTIPFVVKVANAGPGIANNVKVKFPLPTGVTLQSSSLSSGSYNPNTGDWIVGNLGSNTDRTMVLNCVASVGGALSIFTQITASALADPDSSPNNDTNQTPNEDDEVLFLFESAQVDMALQMSVAANDTVQLNDTVAFLLTLTNTGTTGYNTKVRAILPVGLTFVSGVTLAGFYNQPLGVWIVGDVPPNGTQTFLLKAKVTSAGPITFVSEVRTVNQPDFDSTPSNFTTGEDDQAEITIVTSNATNGQVQADLGLSATVSSGFAAASSPVKYVYTLSNAGPLKATNVQVAFVLPAGLTVNTVSNLWGTYTNGIWSVPSLAPGNKCVLTFNATTGTLENDLTLFGQVQAALQPDADSPHGNDVNQTPNEDDEAAATIMYLPPVSGGSDTITDIAIGLTADLTALALYQEITLTLSAQNQSATTAHGVEIDFFLPSTFSYVSDNASIGSFNAFSGKWTIDSLVAGGTGAVIVKLFITTTAPITFFAQVTASDEVDFDSTPNNNTDEIPVEDDEAALSFGIVVGQTPKKCDLALSLSANKNLVSVGDTLVYTFNLNNTNGDTTAYNIQVKTLFPASMALLTQSGGLNTVTGIWSAPNLAVNGSATLIVTVKILNFASTYVTAAQVQTALPLDKDSAPNNGLPGTPLQDDETSLNIVSGPKRSDIALTMTSSTLNYNIGDTITILLSGQNLLGDTLANGLLVRLKYSSNLVFVSSSATTYTNSNKRWNLSGLGIGASKTIILRFKVTQLSNATYCFGQIIRNYVGDKDSKPDNAVGVQVKEDDESKLMFSILQAQLQHRIAVAAPIIKVWPNPAVTLVNITSDVAQIWQLCDATGRVLVVDPTPKMEVVFDVSTLPSGIFTVLGFVEGQLMSQTALKVGQ